MADGFCLTIDQLDAVPTAPGCYLFRNKRGELLYVGKSKSLKSRVKHYFQNIAAKDHKHIRLAKEAASVEIRQTKNEADALILECILIKSLKPRYNAQLKGQNPYPYIGIDLAAPYPALFIAETIDAKEQARGTLYFGCFWNRDDAFQALLLINSVWRTPLCKKSVFTKRAKACLNYHIGRCAGPCQAFVDRDLYRAWITEIVHCFNGRGRRVLIRLNKAMRTAAARLDFEQAARFRDQINGLRQLMTKQKKLNTDFHNRDVYLFFRPYHETAFSLFFIRDGETVSRADFDGADAFTEAALLSFLGGAAQAPFFFDAKDRHKTAGQFLTLCLTDIYADKLFVPVSKKTTAKAAAQRLIRAYRADYAGG